MAVQRKLSILLVKLYANGDRDTIYFRTRAKDVIIDEAKGITLDTIVTKVNNIKPGATKTEKSVTNGNIKIDGQEVQIYKHPTSGVTADTYNSVTVDAQGHVTNGNKVTNWTGSVSGDTSNAIVNYSPASARANIASGEQVKTIAGKIHKWFADLKSMAFVDKVGTTNLDTTLSTFYNNRITKDNVTTSTAITQEGWVADARAIASLKNEINTLNSKIPSHQNITQVWTRYKDLLNDTTGHYIRDDVHWMVTELNMREGCYSFSNYLYKDGPIADLKWGFVRFYKHVSSYITVELYTENSNIPLYVRLIRSSDNVWMTENWKKVLYDDTKLFDYTSKVFPAKGFKANAHSTPNMGGYMFNEDSSDTGMGSDGNGVLYFSQNGKKSYLKDILKINNRYDPNNGVIDINTCNLTGLYIFTGQVKVKNGPVDTFGDATLFVSGKSHGFKMVILIDKIYFQHISWDGTVNPWKKLSGVSV